MTYNCNSKQDDKQSKPKSNLVITSNNNHWFLRITNKIYLIFFKRS